MIVGLSAIICCFIAVGECRRPKVKWITLEVLNDTYRQISFNTSLTPNCTHHKDFVIPLDVESCERKKSKRYNVDPCKTQLCPSLPVFHEDTCLFLKSRKVISPKVIFSRSSYPEEGFVPVLHSNWKTGTNETSYIHMRQKTWAAYSVMKLVPKNRPGENASSEQQIQSCSSNEDEVIVGEVKEYPGRVIFTHQWNERNQHCIYGATIRFKDPCWNNLTPEYNILYDLIYPKDFPSIDTPSSPTPWWVKIAIITISAVIATIGIMVLVKIYCLVLRMRTVNGAHAIEMQSTTGQDDFEGQIQTKGSLLGRKLLLVYACDVKSELCTLKTTLEKQTGFKVFDLYDTEDQGKLEDPSMWLYRTIFDPSTVILLVASKEAKRIKELCDVSSRNTEEEKERLTSLKSTKAIGDSENPTCSSSPENNPEVGVSNTRKDLMDSSKRLSEIKSHNAGDDKGSSVKCLPEGRISISHSEIKEDAGHLTRVPTRSSSVPSEYSSLALSETKQCSSLQDLPKRNTNLDSKRRVEQPLRETSSNSEAERCQTQEALHFLLNEYFTKMINLQLCYDYEKLYQIRFSSSSSKYVLEDVTPGRVYLLPDQQDKLIDVINDFKPKS